MDRPSLLYLALFIAIYLEVPLHNGAGLDIIPSFFLIAPAFVVARAIRGKFIPEVDAKFLFYLTILSLTSAVFAPNFEDIESRLKASLQFTVAAAIFLVAVRTALALPAKQFANLGLLIAATLTAATVLERHSSFGLLSDAFRDLAYRGAYVIYDGDARDIALTGFIRPKAFTSEPSLLGIGFFITSSAALISYPTPRNAAIAVLLALLQTHQSGTPIPLLTVVVASINYAVSKPGLFSIFSTVAVAATIGFGVLLPEKSNEMFQDFSARFDTETLLDIGNAPDLENEKSERLRLIYPYLAVADSASVNPIFGLGMGGKRSLAIYSTVSRDFRIAVGNNAFATVFIYLGLIGGTLFMLIMARYINHQQGSLLMFAVVAIPFTQTLGAFESCRTFGYLGVLAAAAIHRGRHKFGGLGNG